MRDWGGVLAWIVVALMWAFLGTKHIWFDHMTYDGKGTFWTNTIVGLGTLGLAGITLFNVRQTRDVIAAEDRRHQQGLAPMLGLELVQESLEDEREYGFLIYNVHNYGMGIALKINLVLRHSYDTRVTEKPRTDDDEGESSHVDERLEFAISALAPNITYEVARIPWNVDYLEFEQYPTSDVAVPYARMTYYDMFGNQYATHYTDERLGEYDWERPSRLGFAQPEDS